MVLNFLIYIFLIHLLIRNMKQDNCHIQFHSKIRNDACDATILYLSDVRMPVELPFGNVVTNGSTLKHCIYTKVSVGATVVSPPTNRIPQ